MLATGGPEYGSTELAEAQTVAPGGGWRAVKPRFDRAFAGADDQGSVGIGKVAVGPTALCNRFTTHMQRQLGDALHAGRYGQRRGGVIANAFAGQQSGPRFIGRDAERSCQTPATDAALGWAITHVAEAQECCGASV